MTADGVALVLQGAGLVLWLGGMVVRLVSFRRRADDAPAGREAYAWPSRRWPSAGRIPTRVLLVVVAGLVLWCAGLALRILQ